MECCEEARKQSVARRRGSGVLQGGAEAEYSSCEEARKRTVTRRTSSWREDRVRTRSGGTVMIFVATSVNGSSSAPIR